MKSNILILFVKSLILSRQVHAGISEDGGASQRTLIVAIGERDQLLNDERRYLRNMPEQYERIYYNDYTSWKEFDNLLIKNPK
eukprot:Pgem_evm1s16104